MRAARLLLDKTATTGEYAENEFQEIAKARAPGNGNSCEHRLRPSAIIQLCAGDSTALPLSSFHQPQLATAGRVLRTRPSLRSSASALAGPGATKPKRRRVIESDSGVSLGLKLARKSPQLRPVLVPAAR